MSRTASSIIRVGIFMLVYSCGFTRLKRWFTLFFVFCPNHFGFPVILSHPSSGLKPVFQSAHTEALEGQQATSKDTNCLWLESKLVVCTEIWVVYKTNVHSYNLSEEHPRGIWNPNLRVIAGRCSISWIESELAKHSTTDAWCGEELMPWLETPCTTSLRRMIVMWSGRTLTDTFWNRKFWLRVPWIGRLFPSSTT